MALEDNATLVVAQGFVYIGPVATLAPTPTQVDTLDTDTFGSQVVNVQVTGSPTSFTLTVGAATTGALTTSMTAEQIQDAIEGLSTVGAANTDVKGTSLTDGTGLNIGFVGALSGQTLTMTGTGTGGESPEVTVTSVAVPNSWINVGHTSRDELPEFGYDGGKLQMRGSWQRKRLRQVQSADAVEDSLKFTLEQWDPESLALYFGEDAADTDGIFGVDGNFNPVERAVFVVLIDGDARVGFYASKASIQRDAAIKLPLDNLSALPVKASFLNYGTRRLYDWISLDMFSTS